MRTGRPKQPLILSEEERDRLESLAHRARSQPHLARRARVVLACAEGQSNQSVARKLRCSLGMVGKWRARFMIRKWFAKRPRFHVHFTPTYGSWINLVERWFAELTNKRIRRGVFRSVKDLESAIREFIDVHNEDPTPFVWTKSADEILASIARYAQRTRAAHPA